jgi:hypothetical protein
MVFTEEKNVWCLFIHKSLLARWCMHDVIINIFPLSGIVAVSPVTIFDNFTCSAVVAAIAAAACTPGRWAL